MSTTKQMGLEQLANEVASSLWSDVDWYEEQEAAAKQPPSVGVPLSLIGEATSRMAEKIACALRSVSAVTQNEQRLRDVMCPQCRQPFVLSWNDYSDKPETLILRGCPSGGIYDVSIKCPHCDYEEKL